MNLVGKPVLGSTKADFVIMFARPRPPEVGVGKVGFQVAPFLGNGGVELNFVVVAVWAIGIPGTEREVFPSCFESPGDELVAIEIVMTF